MGVRDRVSEWQSAMLTSCSARFQRRYETSCPDTWDFPFAPAASFDAFLSPRLARLTQLLAASAISASSKSLSSSSAINSSSKGLPRFAPVTPLLPTHSVAEEGASRTRSRRRAPTDWSFVQRPLLPSPSLRRWLTRSPPARTCGRRPAASAHMRKEGEPLFRRQKKWGMSGSQITLGYLHFHVQVNFVEIRKSSIINCHRTRSLN